MSKKIVSIPLDPETIDRAQAMRLKGPGLPPSFSAVIRAAVERGLPVVEREGLAPASEPSRAA